MASSHAKAQTVGEWLASSNRPPFRLLPFGRLYDHGYISKAGTACIGNRSKLSGEGYRTVTAPHYVPLDTLIYIEGVIK